MTFTITLSGKKLAAIAIVLIAVVLAMAATVTEQTGAAPAGTGAISSSILQQSDQVTAGELARWIMEKRQDYQLVDLRDPWQFDDYHIPTAVNVPIAQLLSKDGFKTLDRGKKIVVYGQGAGQAAQTRVLLALKGYESYLLNEGITAWWERVMTPTSLRSETQGPAGYQQARQIREFFMGTGRPSEAAAAPAQPLPQAPPLGAPESGKPQQQKLKLGQGCS